MEQKIDNSKRPEDSEFKQQKLPAWQPLLTPNWVIGTFAVIGCVFLAIGIVIITASNSVVERKIRYDNNPACVVDTRHANSTCTLKITIDTKMEAPVYFYYQLSNFYQNHRRYVKSRSDTQLRGELQGSESTCSPIETGLGGKQLYPCGLIAFSYFNDSFAINKTIVVNTVPKTTVLSVTENGIAWSSDKDEKFKLPATIPTTVTDTTTQGVKLPSVTDEPFMVWMRTAGLPTFKKLRYIVQEDIEAGTELSVHITNTYPVSSFGGEKAIVFSTTSWLGGKNDFLGWAYIIVGSICLVLAVLFKIKDAVKPRRLGDMQYFQWAGGASAAAQ